MGMVLYLSTLSDENIDKLLSDPPLIWKVLVPDDPEMYELERKQNKRTDFFSKLFKREGNGGGSKVANKSFELSKNEVTDANLDKAWHGIHFLLTGSTWEGEKPLNFLISGGETIGEIEVGYGPARSIKSVDVKKILNVYQAFRWKNLNQDMSRQK